MINPNPDFFEVIIHKPDFDIKKGLSGINIGFERGIWRSKRCSEVLMNFLPEFVLTHEELEQFKFPYGVDRLRESARIVYGDLSDDAEDKRGEFGELILHVLMRSYFQTIPAIKKIYYKTGRNDNVKGFDAVHVIPSEDGLELWLGEAKFYKNISSAISSVVEEINKHTENDYLRSEFGLITNKIEDCWEYSDELNLLLDPNVSLDDVFKRTCIPVLLTYNSEVLEQYDQLKDKYLELLKGEIKKHCSTFFKSDLPKELKIHLFLMPLKNKDELLEELQKRLESWKNM